MKKRRLYLSAGIVFLLAVNTACSAGNPTTPNRGNLTNLAKAPTTSTEANTLKEISINGRVLDAVTRKPIENATVLIYVIANEGIVNSIKNNSSPVPPAMPNNESPAPSLAPLSSPSPEVMQELSPTLPGATPAPNSTPVPIENEEEISPTQQMGNTPENVNQATPGPNQGNIMPTPVPTPPPAGNQTTEEAGNDIDLTSVLTQLKLNDIKEFKTTTSNDGKFWLNKVPDASTIITVNAAEYKAVSVFNADNTKVVDILLEPIDNSKNSETVTGSVFSANNFPVENALVSPSFIVEESFGVPVMTNGLGEFNMNNVPVGERTFFASVKQGDGKIISFGKNDFEVKKLTEKEKEEAPKKSDANYPIVTVNAVTKYISFKGEVLDLPKESMLKAINAYVTFKKKGQPKEEAFLTSYTFDEKKDNFEIELPELEKGYYYHLEFAAVDKDGFLSYHHINNLSKADEKLKVSFMPSLNMGSTDFIDKDGEKIPVFSWTPVPGVDFYKVGLDRIDAENNVVTLWEGITPYSTAIYPIVTGSGRLDNKYTYNWYVSAIKEGESTKQADKLIFEKLNISSWSDLSRSPMIEFKIDNENEIIEIEDLEETEP